MFNKKIVFFVSLFLTAYALYAADGSHNNTYIIMDRSYTIEGLSRPAALEKELRLPDSPSFSSYGEMTAYVDMIKQQLLNLRLFSSIETVLTEKESHEPDKHIYHLEIQLEDSWTFIPLFYPKYDTNTNLTLETKILYSNFFGSLMDFQIDGYVEVSPIDEIEGVDTGLWEVDTSLGNVNWGDRTYNIQWIQKFDRTAKVNTSETVEDYTYNASSLLLETDFPMRNDMIYKITPGITTQYSYKDRTENETSSIDKEPFSFEIRQDLIHDSINWIGNYREGIYSDLGLLLRYSFAGDSGLKGLSSLETSWYHIFRDNISVTSRAVILTSIDDEQPDLGIYMRGVTDQNLYGHSAFFFNGSLPIKALDWDEVVELQMEPFSDFGLTLRKDKSFSSDQDLRLSSGFSFLFFFDRMTSIQVRATFGWDLLIPETQTDNFEFLLSTSLFY